MPAEPLPPTAPPPSPPSGPTVETGRDVVAAAPTTAPTTHAGPPVAPPTLPGSDPVVKAAPSFPGYEILGELGRGGMGVVYKARQVKANRVVALKMILGRAHASLEQKVRFQVEAEAVARLQHPNIVQLYEVGEHDDLPFFSLEFCAGGSLAAEMRPAPWQARRSAGVIETLARAVHYAHGRGVVHRDLKPANILLASQGCQPPDATGRLHAPLATPKITDFGLAKRLDAGDDLTASGVVMGTPAYMAPEQAAGQARDVGPATDVYALGAILYEMLTGRPPFQGASALEVMQRVRTEEVVPPSKRRRGLPRDLETICLKCLQKEPSRRYASAEALADDLRRFLDGEPVQARPVARPERAWRWCRRYPAVAALLLVLVGGAVGGTVAAVKYYRLAGQKDAAIVELDKAKDIAVGKGEEATRKGEEAVRRGDDLRRNLSQQWVIAGTRALNESDYSLALLWFTRALKLDEDDPEREPAHQLRLANTWRQMPRLVGLYTHDAPPTWAEMHPDGTRVVTASYDGTVRFWDLATAKQVGKTLGHDGYYVFVARFSPDGKRLATGDGDGKVRLWDASTGNLLGKPLEHAVCVNTLVFSSDGKKLAVACADRSTQHAAPPGVDPADPLRVVRQVRPGKPIVALWDLETRAPVPLQLDEPRGSALALSGDGRRVAVMDPGAGSVRVFDTASGARIGSPLRHSEGTPKDFLTFLALGPDGKRLLSGGYDGTLTLWDVDAGTTLRVIPQGYRAFFSPDGSQVLGSGVWDAKTGAVVTEPAGAGFVTIAPGARSGPALWSTGGSGYRALAATGAYNPLSPVLRSPGASRIQAVAGGRFVLVCGNDHAVRLWDLAGQGAALSFGDSYTTGARPGDDGRRVVVFSNTANGYVGVYDTTTGRPVSPLFARQEYVPDASLSPDGRQVVTGAMGGPARLWDAVTGRRIGGPRQDPDHIWRAFFDRRGERLVTLGGYVDYFRGNRASVWNLRTGELLWEHRPVCDWLETALHPNGDWLATANSSSEVGVWELADGRPVTPPRKHNFLVLCPTFSPDGSLLVTCGGDAQARVWEVPSGKERWTITHETKVSAAAFHPAGRRFVTGTGRGTLRVWDAVTGRAASPVMNHHADVHSVAFSPDGRWILSSGRDGTAYLWDAETGERLGPEWRFAAGLTPPALLPDGKRILLPNHAAPARLVDCAAEKRSPDHWQRLAEVESGCRLDDTGAVTPLSPAELAAAWDRLRRDAPAETVVPPERVRSWCISESVRLLWGGDGPVALEVLGQAVRAMPEDEDLRHRRGWVASALGQHDLALDDLRRAAVRYPWAWRDVATAWSSGRRAEEGLRVLAEQPRDGSNDAHLSLASGALRLSLRQWELADRDLTAGIDRGEDDGGWAFLQRGRARAELGRWAAARDDFRAALDRQPDRVEWHRLHAYALRANKELAEFRKAVGPHGLPSAYRTTVEPFAAANAAWTQVVTTDGDLNTAHTRIEWARKQLPADRNLLNTYGLTLYRGRRYPEAAERLHESIKVRGKDGTVWDWLVLAMTYQQMQKPDEARRWFDKAEAWFALPETERLGDRGAPLSWDERLELAWLRDEARGVLKGP